MTVDGPNPRVAGLSTAIELYRIGKVVLCSANTYSCCRKHNSFSIEGSICIYRFVSEKKVYQGMDRTMAIPFTVKSSNFDCEIALAFFEIMRSFET